MSKKTEAALEEAIAAHLADEMDGAYLTSYMLVAKGKTTEDMDRNTTKYLVVTPDGAEYDTALGLAHYAVLSVTDGFREED